MGVTGQYRRAAILLSKKAFQIANDWDDYYEYGFRVVWMLLSIFNNNEIDSARIKIEKSMSYPPELFTTYEGYSDLAYIDGSIKLESNQGFWKCSIAFFERNKYAVAQDYLVGNCRLTILVYLKALQDSLNEDSQLITMVGRAIRVSGRRRDIKMFETTSPRLIENSMPFWVFQQLIVAFTNFSSCLIPKRSILTKRKACNLAAFQADTLESEKRVSSNLEKENLPIYRVGIELISFLIILVVFISGLVTILLVAFVKNKRQISCLAEQKTEIQACIESAQKPLRLNSCSRKKTRQPGSWTAWHRPID